MNADIPELVAHRRAQDAFARVLARVKYDQLTTPTPCAEWSVHDLIGHVIGGNERVAGIDLAPPHDVDRLVGRHIAAGAAAQRVFEQPGALARTFHFTAGDVSGTVLIRLRTIDVFAHAWDLTQATNQSATPDPELADHLLAASRATIHPEFDGPGAFSASEQSCNPSRPAADRLAALLGRKVPGWEVLRRRQRCG